MRLLDKLHEDFLNYMKRRLPLNHREIVSSPLDPRPASDLEGEHRRHLIGTEGGCRAKGPQGLSVGESWCPGPRTGQGGHAFLGRGPMDVPWAYPKGDVELLLLGLLFRCRCGNVIAVLKPER